MPRGWVTVGLVEVAAALAVSLQERVVVVLAAVVVELVVGEERRAEVRFQ